MIFQKDHGLAILKTGGIEAACPLSACHHQMRGAGERLKLRDDTDVPQVGIAGPGIRVGRRMRMDAPLLQAPMATVPGEAGNAAPFVHFFRRVDHGTSLAGYGEVRQEQPAEELQAPEIFDQDTDLIDRLAVAIGDGEFVVLPAARRGHVPGARFLNGAGHGTTDVGRYAQVAVAVPRVEPELELHHLAVIGKRREHRAVALVVEVGAAIEGLPEDPPTLPAFQPVEQDF
ncbi:hypothetical protein D9M70_539270 [compost metagenome]